jgi:hypothetical protein
MSAPGQKRKWFGWRGMSGTPIVLKKSFLGD